MRSGLKVDQPWLTWNQTLNPKSTESIIEVNLFWKLNYNKLPHLLLNSNCGNWKTVYIYKKNTGEGRKQKEQGALQLQLAT